MLSMKVLFVLGLTLTVVSAQIGALGGVNELSGADLKEAENTLKDSLSKLASGEGPSYKLGRIISATQQAVSGSLYTYKVELIGASGTKTCDVQIWSQLWLENGVQVTFDCPDGKVVRKHSP